MLYYRANNVTIHGTPYKRGSVIRLKETELELPELESKFQYAQINEIFVYKDHKIMLTNKRQVVAICPHI